VATDIAESAKGARFITHDDHRFASDVESKEGFGIGDSALDATYFAARPAQGADELPGTTENSLFFSEKHAGVGIEMCGQSFSAF
jgi:hypothetical protein